MITNLMQIPLCDNFLEISMPSTPLTNILRDFRAYRPGNHRDFLSWVAARSSSLGIKSYALSSASSASLYLHALNQVRDFRWRHWCFTREYILKKTTHPTAAGGSPIVTWLPNQLTAVLEAMSEVWEVWKHKGELRGCESVMDTMYLQRETLKKEVKKYCQERGVEVN
jgi:indoleamine 2,3-dioxygenase